MDSAVNHGVHNQRPLAPQVLEPHHGVNLVACDGIDDLDTLAVLLIPTRDGHAGTVRAGQLVDKRVRGLHVIGLHGLDLHVAVVIHGTDVVQIGLVKRGAHTHCVSKVVALVNRKVTRRQGAVIVEPALVGIDHAVRVGEHRLDLGLDLGSGKVGRSHLVVHLQERVVRRICGRRTCRPQQQPLVHTAWACVLQSLGLCGSVKRRPLHIAAQAEVCRVGSGDGTHVAVRPHVVHEVHQLVVGDCLVLVAHEATQINAARHGEREVEVALEVEADLDGIRRRAEVGWPGHEGVRIVAQERVAYQLARRALG